MPLDPPELRLKIVTARLLSADRCDCVAVCQLKLLRVGGTTPVQPKNRRTEHGALSIKKNSCYSLSTHTDRGYSGLASGILAKKGLRRSANCVPPVRRILLGVSGC